MPAADVLAHWMSGLRRLFVLTGAGCSTASGIPDYRDDEGRWKRNQPVRYHEFLRNERARRRYWARSLAGWPLIAAARPNPSHLALAALERGGMVHQLITQNVDGLHQHAGQRRVIDLHGRLAWVDCIDCRLRMPRSAMQALLAGRNPDMAAAPSDPRPDGDAILDPGLEDGFQVPGCPGCGGVLKPGVVFFGENVPRRRVELALQRLRQSDALLVAGSSLSVYSGFRFCREAVSRGIPIALVNRGRTRADALAALKLDSEVGDTLSSLARLVGGTPAS